MGYGGGGIPLSSIYMNQSGQIGTPWSQFSVAGPGWSNLGDQWNSLMNQYSHMNTVSGLGQGAMAGQGALSGTNGALGRLPDWLQSSFGGTPSWFQSSLASAAMPRIDPFIATQNWAQAMDQNAYGGAQNQLPGDFPRFTDPRNMQDFAAQTFGISPQQWPSSGNLLNPGGTG